jgi:hypothetical protein
MHRRYSCVFFLAVLLACLQIPGCGGGGSTTAPLQISAATLPPATVGQPYSWLLRAYGGTSPYTWSQTSGGVMPPGITFTATGNLVGTPITAGNYGPYVFTVTDSASHTAATPSLSLNVTASTITIGTTSLPNGLVNTAYSATLSATGGAAPYTWTETSGGNLPPGLSLTGTSGTIAGTPTTAGSYGPYVFTATDAGNNTATTGNLTITIASSIAAVCQPAGNEAALTSANPYAFLLKGTDAAGNPIDIAGSFTPNGTGGIASAVADYNGFTSGPQQLQVNLAASSYSFHTSGQGCLYLSFSGLAPAAAVKSAQLTISSEIKATPSSHSRAIRKPETAAVPTANVQFAFFLSSFDGTIYHTGRIIEADNSTTGISASGSIHVQAPAAFTLSALQSNYAFGVDGWTASVSSVLRTAIAGTFSNSSGNLSSGYADMDLNGTPTGEMTGGYGTLNATIDTTNGRGTGSYFLTTPNSKLTFDFAFYVLNGSDLFLISTDLVQGSSTTPLLAGRVLASSPTPPALNGYYLLASEGLQTLGINIGNVAQIGTFNANTTGTIPTATIYSNYASTYASNQYPNSSYNIETASGRVSITGLTSFPPLVYLTAGTASDDEIVGFLVGTDVQSSSGVVVGQTTSTPAYSAASITGNYASGTEEDIDGSNGAFLGGFDFSGGGAYTLTSQVTGTVTNVPKLGSITVNADGSGNLDGGNFPLVTNGQVVFAIPDSGDPLLFVLIAGTLP